MQGKSFSAKVTVDGDAVEYTDGSCFTVETNTWDGSAEIIDYDQSCGTDVVIPKTITVGASTTSTTQNSGTISTLERSSSEAATLSQTANTFTVTSIEGTYEYDFEQDEEGNDVNSICLSYQGAFQNKGLTSIIIPDTVTEIGYSSARNFCGEYDEFGGNNIDHITIPEGVTRIGDFSANSIFIPDTVEYIRGVVLPTNTVIPCTFNQQSVNRNFIRYDRTCSVVEAGEDDSYY